MHATASSRPRLFTIPPHADFLATLARAMRSGTLLPVGWREEEAAFPAFAGWRIFLPTRRAARALAAALLDARGGEGAQLLPRILPLGDVDEDALLLAAEEPLVGGAEAVLPPAIEPLPRLFLLARLMLEWTRTPEGKSWRLADHLRHHPGAALRLARSLARLIDSFEHEEVPLDAVDELAAAELFPEKPEHRLAARELLRFLARAYPAALDGEGLMGAAARRARLLRLQAEALRREQPRAPVIAAGSTGTIPATAELLSVISRLPAGCVVLPGLDTEMDEASWAALEPGHPQYGMKQLLERIGADRSEVRVLGNDGAEAAAGQEGYAPLPREVLLSEALRPVATTEVWRQRVQELHDVLQEGARNLHLLRAPTRRLEALSIALLMRETLEQPGRTCMFVTPDRQLARAVQAELARWDVRVDDSAGLPLADTPGGMFVKLLLDAALAGFDPPSLAALLAHPFACFGMTRRDCRAAGEDLQLAVLHSLTRFDGLAALPEHVRMRRREAADPERGWREHPNVQAMSEERWQRLEVLAAEMARRLTPLARVFETHAPRSFGALLERLLTVAEDISTPPDAAASLLWRGERGEALALAFSEMLRQSEAAPDMTPADAAGLIVTELAARVVRPHGASHARLAILGPLEARLLCADRIILGGLNEGIWPETTQNDPWLTRHDKQALHLPTPERRIGLAAHDFAQLAAQGEVWLTCADKVEQKPMEPSRWILRLQAVLQGALEADDAPLRWAAALDLPENRRAEPVSPPRPMPSPHLRPRHISASRVRTLLNDPYAIFARHILRLEPVQPLSRDVTPMLFGTMVHEALEEFVRRWPRELPDDAAGALFALLVEKHRECIGNEEHLQQVRERLKRMARWFVHDSDCERSWRRDLLRAHPECEGRITFDIAGGPFSLSARADRLDVLADGGLRIIDYKTGTLPKRRGKEYDPQIDLEAAIAMQGGFGDAGDAHDVRELLLVRVHGGEPPGKVDKWHERPKRGKTPPEYGPAWRAEQALAGLKRLLECYADPAQPYLPLDHGQRPRENDYDHLSRWREWLPLLTIDGEAMSGGE